MNEQSHFSNKDKSQKCEVEKSKLQNDFYAIYLMLNQKQYYNLLTHSKSMKKCLRMTSEHFRIVIASK